MNNQCKLWVCTRAVRGQRGTFTRFSCTLKEPRTEYLSDLENCRKKTNLVANGSLRVLVGYGLQ